MAAIACRFSAYILIKVVTYKDKNGQMKKVRLFEAALTVVPRVVRFIHQSHCSEAA